MTSKDSRASEDYGSLAARAGRIMLCDGLAGGVSLCAVGKGIYLRD